MLKCINKIELEENGRFYEKISYENGTVEKVLKLSEAERAEAERAEAERFAKAVAKEICGQYVPSRNCIEKIDRVVSTTLQGKDFGVLLGKWTPKKNGTVRIVLTCTGNLLRRISSNSSTPHVYTDIWACLGNGDVTTYPALSVGATGNSLFTARGKELAKYECRSSENGDITFDINVERGKTVYFIARYTCTVSNDYRTNFTCNSIKIYADEVS